MDDSTLTAAFRAHTVGQTMFTRRMAITIGLAAGQSPRQIVLRLEGLGLLRRGSWDWFVHNGGITRDQVAEVAAEIRACAKAPPR
ncbi:MAG: hypothetical protein IKE60_02230 [Reyranella sp.]|uniref:hypothetical protein n=1 Tax=Reyranella sp. TaxID=1929291 RepID=UPI0025F1C089|nr:hypothetical protein [Reyranella sp.]MBR2813439.1 hypothetical protein [Reyranella sp.]